MVRTGDEEASW